MTTSVQRTIECLTREVAQIEADRWRFETRCESLELHVAALTAERDELKAGLEVLMAEHERRNQRVRELESLACANPACQLCQMN